MVGEDDVDFIDSVLAADWSQRENLKPVKQQRNYPHFEAEQFFSSNSERLSLLQHDNKICRTIAGTCECGK